MTIQKPKFVARSIVDYFESSVMDYGPNIALNFMGHTHTYAELGRLVNKIAAGLQNMNVMKGTRVGICLPNCSYYPMFYFAILKIGGVVVNFNPLYVKRELAYQANDAGVKLMITLDMARVYDNIEALRKDGVLDRIIICPLGDHLNLPKKILLNVFKRKELAKYKSDHYHITFDDVLQYAGNARPNPTQIQPHKDIALLQYTGGTTGVPKGVILTHANISANMEQVKLRIEDIQFGAEKSVCVVPFFHVLGMTAVQNLSIMVGAELILVPRFEVKKLVKEIHKRRPTLMAGVPAIFGAVNNFPSVGKYDLTSIKYGLSGGAPLPVEVKQKFEELGKCEVVEGYGLSESSPLVSVNPLGAGKPGSIGTVVDWTTVEFRDLEKPDKKVAQGEKGEICVKGPQVMQGYWNKPEETEKVLEGGKLLRTGDVGYMDKDGYIFLVDRIKDLILCSGYNVYPRVIEDALYEHPLVEEVTVIGVKDDYRGEAPKAFIKLKPGNVVLEKDIRTHLSTRISKIEMPRDIVFRDELPKTLVGKLSKKELYEEEEAKKTVASFKK